MFSWILLEFGESHNRLNLFNFAWLYSNKMFSFHLLIDWYKVFILSITFVCVEFPYFVCVYVCTCELHLKLILWIFFFFIFSFIFSLLCIIIFFCDIFHHTSLDSSFTFLPHIFLHLIVSIITLNIMFVCLLCVDEHNFPFLLLILILFVC